MSFGTRLRMIVGATGLLAVLGPAEGGMSGVDLLSLCREVEGSQVHTVNAAQCVGYVEGVADGWDAARKLLYPKRSDIGFCIPKGLTRGELARVVSRFILAHSNDAEAHSALLVLAALIETYPCE